MTSERRHIGFCLLAAVALALASAAFAPLAHAQAFSDMERNHIRVRTPGLFTDSQKELLICPMDLEAEGFCFPLEGCKLISPYGGKRRTHSGIDLKTVARDTIRCAFDGVVRMAKTYSGYGLAIVVRHPSGLETVYSHNAKNFVKSGDHVKAGQAIALVGRTGRATTEHLHFETRINGQAFDPELLFDIPNHCLRKNCLRCTLNGTRVTVKDATADE